MPKYVLRDFQEYARGKLPSNTRELKLEHLYFLEKINHMAVLTFDNCSSSDLPDIDKTTPLSEEEWAALCMELESIMQ
ncbi:MAG: hypothetical protein COU90_04270 [Candidatus Ryanbacteria bacterium CG10_big_fil_rev_8_21_14_0_10_43_42]|uniref:Uncharacterized protein n=1 Tax=Candidatus Ryanbacteria bacterium CG10_big_fil_rev_8_21_14_0_10_43_42 TaxID=1974864 RepID=A0A2M8KVV8_9BACT|nr:MAG: hypothetical protein COU90_04270 [Candidatus Ryanbacteria bacterium CG10_big_fil_rev_8_21_14_0_10_43_42]